MWEYTSIIVILGSAFFFAYISNFLNEQNKFSKYLKKLFIPLAIWFIFLLFAMNGQIIEVKNTDTSLDSIYSLNSVIMTVTMWTAFLFTAIMILSLFIENVESLGSKT